MNWLALVAFAVLFTVAVFGATWFAARLANRGGSTSPQPDASDYGRASLDRLPRAPSLPPPGFAPLMSEPPPVPSEQRWRTVTVPIDDYRADPLRWERMASGWTRVVVVDGRGNRYASISSDDGVQAATLKMEKP